MQVGLTFDEYQKRAAETAVYPRILILTDEPPRNNEPAGWIYPALGLSGETGELVDKLKKVVRDRRGIFDLDDYLAISREMGDVLWYLSALATELGLSLSTIAEQNLEKLASRKARGFLHGQGDTR